MLFPAQAKLASFACFDVEKSELRVFDSKVDRAASEATRRGRTRVIQRRFNVSVPRARVPGKASTLRDRSER